MDEESKHTPSHLASVFADILNPSDKIDESKNDNVKIESSKRSKQRKLDDGGDNSAANSSSSSTTTTNISATKRDRNKREWDNLNRTKPDPIVDRDLERSLARIATRGVVQLFNAIKEHQARVGEAVAESGTTSSKMERKVKSIVKKDRFLDLVSSKKSTKTTGGGDNGTIKVEDDDDDSDEDEKPRVSKKRTKSNGTESKPKSIKIEADFEDDDDAEPAKRKWDVLRDDFLENSDKNWDKDDE